MSEHQWIYSFVDHVEDTLGYIMEHLQTAVLMMIVTTGGWFSGLSENLRNFIAVATIAAAGFTAGVLMVNFTQLPEQVALNTQKNAEIAENIEDLNYKVGEFEKDIGYLVQLSTWSLCAIRVHDNPQHDNSPEGLVAICGREPLPTRR